MKSELIDFVKWLENEGYIAIWNGMSEIEYDNILRDAVEKYLIGKGELNVR
jgi:hypothetical protein